MKTIYKYTICNITVADTILELPCDAEILAVGSQYSEVVMWVKLDTDGRKVRRRFVTFGTGHEIPSVLEPMRYIGTSFIGPLVFHSFELAEVTGGVDATE